MIHTLQYWEDAEPISVFLYGKRREVLAYERLVMLKNLRCPVRVVWVFNDHSFLLILLQILKQ